MPQSMTHNEAHALSQAQQRFLQAHPSAIVNDRRADGGALITAILMGTARTFLVDPDGRWQEQTGPELTEVVRGILTESMRGVAAEYGLDRTRVQRMTPERFREDCDDPSPIIHWGSGEEMTW